MNNKVRVRFAPSPTGYMHIGGARTTIFNYLFARHHDGSFVLRIEDTDRVRSTKESEEAILRDLKWLGLSWDESVDVGGPYGPYRQSERMDIYRRYAEKLLKEGKAYKCYCTEEELEQRRKEAISKGLPPKYDGRCRNLSEEEKKKFEEEGRKPSLRFRVDDEGPDIVVHDLIRGDVSFKRDVIGDFVIMRKDNTPTYNFACVIDDYLMKITHVIRGEEHLSNTPRQLLLYEALGFEPPLFAHVSMILGPDRTKLSKRHGDTSLEEYRKKGYLPDALFNYLALLGWSPGDDREILSKEELIELFSLERVAKSPAVFDMGKLNWMNGIYIRKTPDEKLLDMLLPYFEEMGVDVSKRKYLLLITKALKDNLEVLSDIKEKARIFFERPEVEFEFKKEDIEILNLFIEEISDDVNGNPDKALEFLKKYIKKTGKKAGKVLPPLRMALTGEKHGVELNWVVAILGKEECVERIKEVISS